MSEDEQRSDETVRRRGRPAGKRPSLSFRITPALRAQLEEAASKANRSLGEEIETRIEQSFWQDAIKAHEKEEFDRFSLDAYIKRLKVQCGGEEGFDFAMALGDHMKLVRLKHGVGLDVDLMTLPEEKRRELAADFVSVLPLRFGLWELADGESGQRAFDVLTGSGRVKINPPKAAG